MRALLVVVAAALAGCPTPPVARPYPEPSAADLLGHLEARAHRLKTLRAEAKVDYLAEKGERVKVTMTFLAEAPDRLRMDAESPLGGNVASLATDGRDFQLLDVRNNRFLVGEATPCNIARLIRIELRPADAIAVLAGSAPLPAGVDAAAARVGWDPADGGREVLTLTRGGEIETIKLDARGRRWDVVWAELRTADGKVVYRVAHDEFEDAGGERFPAKTVIEQPARSADARIRFRSREANPQLPAGAFHLTPPPGLPVEQVRCD